jgi:RNA polymerase sigma-70 factor (ECF subfamily)
LNEPGQPSIHGSAADSSARQAPDVPALTRAMAKGDEMAYRDFYHAYFDRLLRYLLVVARGHEESAREALQLTLLRVVRHVRAFPDEAAFWSWLTVVARSALTDETRKRSRYFAFLDRFTFHSAAGQSSGPAGEADDQLQALLESRLRSLPCEEQDLVRQKYFEGQSVREIAGRLLTTEKAVESRLSRIRRKLKEAVLAALKDEPPR